MKTIEVIYSPVCEASIAFLGRLREWLKNENVQIIAVPYDKESNAQVELYRDNGLLVQGRMIESCFIDVFYEGKRIDSVPLSKEKIYSALEIAPVDELDVASPVAEEVMTLHQVRKAILNDSVSWIPLTNETVADEMTLCLCNYPFGNPPERFHQQCMDMKLRVFEEVWAREKCAGIYAKLDDKVIGLLEVFPREILKKYGFMTGSVGCDTEYLTVGCYEVGYGMPRTDIIDELMRRLELIYGMFTRKNLEGIGVFEWPDGFTPYWVYDKYGFSRQEIITESKVVMAKRINITTPTQLRYC